MSKDQQQWDVATPEAEEPDIITAKEWTIHSSGALMFWDGKDLVTAYAPWAWRTLDLHVGPVTP